MDIPKIKKAIINYNGWLKTEMKKVEKKVNKKDISFGSLYAKIIELAKECGGSVEFHNFIEKNCR